MGALNEPLDHIETLIAQSAAFQAWVSAVDSAAAKVQIIQVAVLDSFFSRDGEGDLALPYALIEVPESAEFDRVAGGAKNYFMPSGVVAVQFVAPIPVVEQGDDSVAFKTYWDTLDSVVTEMIEVAGEDQFISIRRVRMTQRPMIGSEDEAATKGHFFICVFEFEWGI